MSRGGVLIEIEHNSPTVISKLTLANVVSSDSGIYSCKSGAGSDSIQLHVIEGKDCVCNFLNVIDCNAFVSERFITLRSSRLRSERKAENASLS